MRSSSTVTRCTRASPDIRASPRTSSRRSRCTGSSCAKTRREVGADGSSSMSELRQLSEVLWEIPATARSDMRVPARVFADRDLLAAIERDGSLDQIQNVATLPGVTGAALAMPDVHQGYGFPVGGVAATELPDGVVSPGGVGYDINCGVRLLALPLTATELGARREPLVHELSRSIPAGAGKTKGRTAGLDEILEHGPAQRAPEGDLERTESRGCLPGADPAAVSERAKERGGGQLGTMGSGNHFVELQRVARVFDDDSARAFGLRHDQVTVLIHSGSRGLGHQVCGDYVKQMDAVMRRYGIELPDRQLACVLSRRPRLPSGDGRRRQLRLGEPPGDRRLRPQRRLPRAGPAERRGCSPGLRRRPQRGEGRTL